MRFQLYAKVIRAELDECLGAGPSYRVVVLGPPWMTFDVDGHPETAGYAGHYFATTPVRIDVATQAERSSHWVINGRRHDGATPDDSCRRRHGDSGGHDRVMNVAVADSVKRQGEAR